MKTITVNLKINCINPPATSESVRFGLQDKQHNVFEGVPLDDGNLQFACEVNIKQMESGRPNFTGTFTHGTTQERFLYLTFEELRDGIWQIIRRIKVHLKSITWEQVEATIANEGSYLAVTVDGRGAASTKLLGDGWKVRHS